MFAQLPSSDKASLFCRRELPNDSSKIKTEQKYEKKSMSDYSGCHMPLEFKSSFNYETNCISLSDRNYAKFRD